MKRRVFVLSLHCFRSRLRDGAGAAIRHAERSRVVGRQSFVARGHCYGGVRRAAG